MLPVSAVESGTLLDLVCKLLNRAPAARLRSKVCGQASPLLGTVDANRCCNDRFGTRMLRKPGAAVPY